MQRFERKYSVKEKQVAPSIDITLFHDVPQVADGLCRK